MVFLEIENDESPLEAPVTIASLPSRGRFIVLAVRFVDAAR